MTKHTENTMKIRDGLLEVRDVMELYHVSRLTVYRWIKAGKLKGKKAGGKWLFSRESVLAVLE